MCSFSNRGFAFAIVATVPGFDSQRHSEGGGSAFSNNAVDFGVAADRSHTVLNIHKAISTGPGMSDIEADAVIGNYQSQHVARYGQSDHQQFGAGMANGVVDGFFDGEEKMVARLGLNG